MCVYGCMYDFNWDASSFIQTKKISDIWGLLMEAFQKISLKNRCSYLIQQGS